MIPSFLTRAGRIATIALALMVMAVTPLRAADFPAPKEGNWVIQNFRFASGQVLPQLKVNYLTVGEATGQAKWWKQQLPAFLAKDAGNN